MKSERIHKRWKWYIIYGSVPCFCFTSQVLLDNGCFFVDVSLKGTLLPLQACSVIAEDEAAHACAGRVTCPASPPSRGVRIWSSLFELGMHSNLSSDLAAAGEPAHSWCSFLCVQQTEEHGISEVTLHSQLWLLVSVSSYTWFCGVEATWAVKDWAYFWTFLPAQNLLTKHFRDCLSCL